MVEIEGISWKKAIQLLIKVFWKDVLKNCPMKCKASMD